MPRRRLALIALSILSTSLFIHSGEEASAANKITVGDGGSVVAAVASASNGDTVEIKSNQTFVGTLHWLNKFITIQAGAGFSPTIKGSPGSDAISSAWGNVGSGAGGAIKDVKLQSGGNRAVTISDGIEATISFDRVTFDGGLLLGGTSNHYSNSRFSDCIFLDEFAIGSTGEAFTDVVVERSRIAGVFRAGAGGHSGFNILAVDNVLAKTVPSPFNTGVILGGDQFGTANPTARFVNTTVVGWPVGILVADKVKVSFENMLLNNTDDIGRFDSPATISNSLISDGTFAGTNGNFGGTPLLDDKFSLRPGSPGIDAGNNAATRLPLTDIRGFPRILDGNLDGFARVDVGAYEVVPEPDAFALAVLTVVVVFQTRVRRSRSETI